MKVGRLDDFPEGRATLVTVDDEDILICNVGGHLYAIQDRCTHDDSPLGECELEGCEIECPRHGARFDVRDGSVTLAPAVFPVETYQVKVANGFVWVEIE